MATTERLFRIVQILRRARTPVRAAQLAQELEVSVRTVYRYVAELQAQQVPIQGEAGVGYILAAGYELPPLMLTEDELEAALLGAQWVAQRGDPALANGARDLMTKLQAVLPSHMQANLRLHRVEAVDQGNTALDRVDAALIRRAIRGHRKIQIRYREEQGVCSERTLWPVMIAYFDAVRLVVAWCELRNDFRHFRTDRILALQCLDEIIPCSDEDLLQRWRARR